MDPRIFFNSLMAVIAFFLGSRLWDRLIFWNYRRKGMTTGNTIVIGRTPEPAIYPACDHQFTIDVADPLLPAVDTIKCTKCGRNFHVVMTKKGVPVYPQ